MRTIIHDLSVEEETRLLASQYRPDDKIFSPAKKAPIRCQGCFGCWIKTPGVCVIKDGYEMTGAYTGNSSELIIVTECKYGDFSPQTKKVIDRSISNSHPFFVERNGETHHKRRYSNEFALRVFYYGDRLTDEEKECMEGRVKAFGINASAIRTEAVYIEKREGEIVL